MQFEERALAFPCHDAWLYGILSLPQPPQPRGVLVVVGGPQYRAGSHRQFTLLARSLAAAGTPVMRFDYRGMGDSDGEVRDFEAVADDVRAAIDRFFAEVPGLREVALWGLCDGASAAVLHAHADPRVTGLALLNPWVRTEEGAAKATIKHYYRDRLFDAGLWKKIARGQFDLVAAAKSFADNARKAFARRAAPAPGQSGAAGLPDRVRAGLERFEGKVLLMLSEADLTAQEFSDIAAGPGWRRLLSAPRFTRYSLPKADHTCSRREWHEQMVAWTLSWIRSW
ncbi:hydrolase 1, exosortase A system-associated [Massilia consociata]|uniref:Hydrolase 1, exosortase A system-associated n=1 Tax=Massilia consociata TaxID=760117 RepID=A0ABV6FCX1_9BURK